MTEPLLKDEVIGDIEDRARIGTARYSRPLEAAEGDPLHWAVEAYEEALDQVLYLKRLIRELRRAQWR